MGMHSVFCIVLFVLGVLLSKVKSEEIKHDYADALSKSILFFEGQRSGKLPPSQRMKWRKNSALHDGQDVGVDLTGGYYDAGDNVKFNFPMAFTTTMLAWSTYEFSRSMSSADLAEASKAVRWGTDYLLKSTSITNKVFVQVGDPWSDHSCWQRPEDMDTKRTAYAVTAQNPGSEVSAEIAAALASSSIIFKSADPAYSQKLLQRAIQVFNFADQYRGSFNDSLGHWVCPFYCDFSGYQDELLWAAAWLYKATNQKKYWNYVVNNFSSLKIAGDYHQDKSCEFGWDNKNGGVFVLMATELLATGQSDDNVFRYNADRFVCFILPESPTRGVKYSPGGLIFKPVGSNMQNPTAISFLILVYSRFLARANKVVQCGDKTATPQRIQEVAKGQVDYILGSNPMKMSYMVGYGNKYPQRIHHRGSSLPSLDQHPQHLACQEGKPYFDSSDPNPNELTGAVVGGPLPNDTYPDKRVQFTETEPTTYINAPLVGLLSYFNNPKQF